MFTPPLRLVALCLLIASSETSMIPLKNRADTHLLEIPRTVYDCPITDPNARSVWKAGERAVVVWDTRGIPFNTTSKGKIELGYFKGKSSNEHLDIENPLAEGFSILDGRIDVTVPRVKTGRDYIVVLMGDSGNHSPAFTIS
ncbi:hypothetical protein PAXRUDRAFT_832871 [Paxillus rubicundulus Ve08.2h10]|uniref:Uncharacterized protein n=1 Tax=Paxillus rubicundulus Ve08.2h10 TaxID=930991 RepID=A0A0D0DBG3_9AGAM|nr:hypothetical protein PAXRUDRAFT_832871 [Paxillus rubicundulus Ve08.2h10]